MSNPEFLKGEVDRLCQIEGVVRKEDLSLIHVFLSYYEKTGSKDEAVFDAASKLNSIAEERVSDGNLWVGESAHWQSWLSEVMEKVGDIIKKEWSHLYYQIDPVLSLKMYGQSQKVLLQLMKFL